MLGSALPQREGISSTIRCRGWSPSFCGRRQGRVRLQCRWYEYQLEGLSSVSLRLTAPSAEGAFWCLPRRFPVPTPSKVVAALSAAVTSTPKQKTRPCYMGAQVSRNSQAYSQLLFGRGSGGGKDSHSRQWRLSMAVFLNRNKRPSAAPIEVAEASLREAASPGVPFLPRSVASLREAASLAYLSNKKEGVLC